MPDELRFLLETRIWTEHQLRALLKLAKELWEEEACRDALRICEEIEEGFAGMG